MPYEVYPDYVQTKTGISKKEIWSRLLESKKQQILKREKFFRDKQEFELKQKCTFRPKIKVKNDFSDEEQIPVQERLYEEGMQ